MSASFLIDDSPSAPREPRDIASYKRNKCIKFFKDQQDQQLTTGDEKKEEIDLNKAIKADVAYGKIDQKESKQALERKRNHMLQDDYYSSTINQEKIINMTRLPEYISMEDEELTKNVEDIFDDVLNKAKDAKGYLDSIKSSLESYNLDELYSTVGAMYTVDSLNYIMNLPSNALEKPLSELKKEILATRFIYNDGDSFYRAFMFAWIEHQILYQDVTDFNKLIYGFYHKIRTKKFNRKDVKINVNEIIMVFFIIYQEMQKGNIKEAYKAFLISINHNRNFDSGLIKFMKIAIAEYIEKNANLIFKEEHWEEIEAIAAPAYLSEHSFNWKDYIENRILTMNYEADKFIVQISPVVFHVNLALYAIEGTAKEVKEIAYLKNFFKCLSDNTSHEDIALFYHFCRYERLYKEEILKLHEANMIYKRPNSVVKKERFVVVSSGVKCETCGETSDEICFNHIPDFNFCKSCISSALNKIITQRLINLINENYNNMGYYCRKVELKGNFQYSLGDEDFIALFNRNIAQQILHTYENMCAKCKKPVEDANVVKLSCGCKMCQDCVKENIIACTDGKIILNRYEEKNLKIKPVTCTCGKPFDYKGAIDLVYQKKIADLTKQANERLIKISEISCVYCLKQFPKATQSKSVGMNTNTRVNEEPFIKFHAIDGAVSIPHLICKSCLPLFMSEIENLKKIGKISPTALVYPIKCKICGIEHNVEAKKLGFSRKGQDTACCKIF